MIIKLKDSRETIGAPPFCNHAASRLQPNASNIPNCGLVLNLARYRVSRALEASLISAEHVLLGVMLVKTLQVGIGITFSSDSGTLQLFLPLYGPHVQLALVNLFFCGC